MKRRYWTDKEIAMLRMLYPHYQTQVVAARLRRSAARVYAKATALGIGKSTSFLASAASGRLTRLSQAGAPYRYQKGHLPANKGLRRPGWSAGRMTETQFKKGQLPHNADPDFYVIGALRVNSEGYIEMRTSFAHGALGWRPLHRILWEDARGPVPRGYVVTFKNGDKLDCELRNLKLITLAQNMRRNTLHRYPREIVRSYQMFGALRRQINRREKHERQDADRPA